MTDLPFYKIQLDVQENLFDKLAHSVDFEHFANDKKATNLLLLSDNKVPIVRTTSIYEKPAQCFAPIHQFIADAIQAQAKKELNLGENIQFNNALMEIYSQSYFKMKYHSDQALDLASDSYIALYSCYEQPAQLPLGLRTLKIQSKNSQQEFQINLAHNSVVLFSTASNQNYLHKIILEPQNRPRVQQSDNQWLGITFRQSKTFIQFENNLPFFANGQCLKQANIAEVADFYKMRTAENQAISYNYPDIFYTISPSDMLPPLSI